MYKLIYMTTLGRREGDILGALLLERLDPPFMITPGLASLLLADLESLLTFFQCALALRDAAHGFIKSRQIAQILNVATCSTW